MRQITDDFGNHILITYTNNTIFSNAHQIAGHSTEKEYTCLRCGLKSDSYTFNNIRCLMHQENAFSGFGNKKYWTDTRKGLYMFLYPEEIISYKDHG